MSGDIHALSGAYAVDAVDDLERAAFERHLAECDTCRDEVSSLRDAAVEIATISAAAPPAALRDRVLAGVETVRPLPPVLAAAQRSTPALPRRRHRRASTLVAAAAALVVIGGTGATVWHPWSDGAPAQTQLSAADRVLNAPDAETYSRLQNGVTISVTQSESLDRSVLSTSGLAPLSREQVYELWLQHDSEMISAGFLKDPTSPVVLQGSDTLDATAAGITIEPAGGSEDPSYGNLVGTVSLGQA